MLSFEKERLTGKVRTGILGLGTDGVPRISWVQEKTLCSVLSAGPVRDVEEFYRSALSLVRRRIRRVHFLAFDPHPLFISSQKAPDFRDSFFPESSLVPVYHHWAHAANGFWDIPRVKKFLAVVFDGTGYGCDGQVWGGEFFLCAPGGFRRLAHLSAQPLVGGDRGVLEPWRMAYLVLQEAQAGMAERFFDKIPEQKRFVIRRMKQAGLQTLPTSSAGRLFDAAAAILGLKQIVRRPAEAAQALEKAARHFRPAKSYDFPLKRPKRGPWVIETTPVLVRMAKDRQQSRPAGQIAMKFHLGLAKSIFETSCALAQEHGVADIYLCGGVFCNRLLTQVLRESFQTSRYVLHVAPEPTDKGLSRGQVAYGTFVR